MRAVIIARKTMAFETERRPLGSGYDVAGRADAVPVDAGLRAYMLRVYNYMASGLFLSGLVAMVVANTPAITELFFKTTETGRMAGYTGLGLVAVFAPIGLMLAMSFGQQRMKTTTLQALYWAFVALMGISLSTVLMIYTGVSVTRVFFVTAAAFGGLSLYGYTTKRDLSVFRTFLMMGLIGLVIASLVQMFFPSTMMHFVISVVGVLLFAGLTAHDTQSIKNQYLTIRGSTMEGNSAVMGAVSLYLDFINLFQFLMALMGQRRE